MRAFAKRLLICTAGLAVAAGVAVATAAILVFDNAPRVARPAAVAPADAGAVGDLLRAADPGSAGPAGLRVVVAGERQLDLLLDRAARRWPGAAAHVELLPGAARLHASVEVPPSPIGRWLNVRADLVQSAGLPRLDRLAIGRLTLPGWLAEPSARWLLRRADAGGERRRALELVASVGFEAGRARFVLARGGVARERLVAALAPPAERERLAAYAVRLEALAAAAPPGGVSLAAVLPPIFDLARRRSLAGGDAAQENRAAILALALRAASAATAGGRAPLRLTLAGREDFPQHLLISAALAMEGGGAFADAVGLYKEIADTGGGGSGFSFNDIAADRAGTQLGLLALGRPAELQARLAAGVAEADFMPDVSDLPEFLSAPELRRRYGGAGAPAYDGMLARIEARVGALRLAAPAPR